MPILGNEMEAAQTAQNNFGFSRTRMGNLGSTEYTLVTVVNDVSGSTAQFTKPMEDALKEVFKSCRKSPRADSLLMRHIVFGTRVFPDTVRGHGWKLLANLNENDYTGSLAPDDLTALYDATLDAVEVTISQAQDMRKQDYEVNAVIFVITDGLNNSSTATTRMIKAAIERARQSETLQSVLTVLIGVNVTSGGVQQGLDDFKNEAGFDQYVELANATQNTLAKLAQFVSKSISSSSTALATKGPSVPINPASIGI